MRIRCANTHLNTTMNNLHTTLISEEPVTVPQHFNELNQVKLKYHLQMEELIEV